MVDPRAAGFYALWRADPVPVRRVSLRFMASTLNTPAAFPIEANRLPALVINPIRDQMVDPAVTLTNYLRLGGPKAYAPIDYGHWAMGEEFVQEWADLVDRFLRLPIRSSPGAGPPAVPEGSTG
jgi:hypothetical protein